jgi:hypothetical protein
MGTETQPGAELAARGAETLRAMPPNARKEAILQGAQSLPPEDRAAIAEVLVPPRSKANDTLWLIIVVAFAIVLVGSFVAIALSAFIPPVGATAVQTILTLFTTAGALLAGLLAPSPIQKGSGAG